MQCRRQAGDGASIPGSGRSPGGGNGHPPQYFCLGNPISRGTWWATVHGISKELDTTERLNIHTYMQFRSAFFIHYYGLCIFLNQYIFSRRMCFHDCMVLLARQTFSAIIHFTHPVTGQLGWVKGCMLEWTALHRSKSPRIFQEQMSGGKFLGQSLNGNTMSNCLPRRLYRSGYMSL